MKERQGDWAEVLGEYLYTGPQPLINGYTGGRESPILCGLSQPANPRAVGHPFIHLAYAFEFRSKEVATQALSQGCTEYNPLHHLLDRPPPDTATYKTTSLSAVFENVRIDARLNRLFSEPGIANLEVLQKPQHLTIVLEHWNAWEVKDPMRCFEECCDLSVLLALSNGNPHNSFDFYDAHIMTVAHALRVLWHYLPPQLRVSVLRQYALFAIMTYICQQCPGFALETFEAVTLDGRDWEWVVDTALSHKWALDVHFFKVIRAPKAFEETFGRKENFYLKAAVKYVTEFRGWEGYGKGVAGFVPSRDGYRPG